ncbi:MAG TPA: DUF6220 domain-containing protein [Candidatus Limnocylindria bacterium]|jgi:hypothetical protein
MRSISYAYAISAWLFFAGVVYQVFLAGIGLLGGGDMTAHMGFGYLLPLVAILLFLVGWAAQPDRRTFRLTLLLMVLTLIQPNLPLLRDVSPALAALHPVNALAIFWLALTVARGATTLVGRPTVARDEVQVPR